MRFYILVTIVFMTFCTLTLSACGKSESVKIGGEAQEGEMIEKIRYTVPMPSGGEEKYDDLEEGEEVWFAMGALTGVGEYNANGVAQGSYYASGVFRHGLNLNIEKPSDGFFYEGWLVNPATKEFVSTGHLRSRFGDVRHGLAFEEEHDYRDYTEVVITIEPDDGNPDPAEHVAKGQLVPRDR